ncbi:sugar ABC transporter permease, partial [Listeria monocytogenes]|nr:sugar ABC transporter permease [Listeria monocytogenes]
MKKVLSQIRANRIWLLMVLPGVLWFLVFSYLPMFGTVIAFKDYKIDGKGFLSS